MKKAEKKLKLFLDANIFIAGSASLQGGSAFILTGCKNEIWLPVTNQLVLQEAEKNIRKKLGQEVLSNFLKWRSDLPLIIQPSEPNKLCQNIIDPKDEHVLSGAIGSNSDFLITLDRKHFFTDQISKANLPIKIATPKNFILTVIKNDCTE